ncbi:MAG: hypothetical protein JKX94_03885 [Sneathiella sp.]|nr:hypothetical protein [Sneathiella sp.]
MQEFPATFTSIRADANDRFSDPIIEREDVMWAARKFILLFGEDAPLAASKEVNRLDAAGKLHVAEMFFQVKEECARLLKKSEKLRTRPVH